MVNSDKFYGLFALKNQDKEYPSKMLQIFKMLQMQDIFKWKHTPSSWNTNSVSKWIAKGAIFTEIKFPLKMFI